jgi:hypothetical protein
MPEGTPLALTSLQTSLKLPSDRYTRENHTVALLHHLLILLTFARLLAPPGICLCQSAAPAVNSLAWLLGQDDPLPATEPVEDHDPGCPASGLSEAMGLQPPAFAFLWDAALLDPVDPPQAAAVMLPGVVSLAEAGPVTEDRYLILCALLL